MGSYLRFMINVFILYITPLLVLLFFSGAIKRHFNSRKINLKAADLLVPFLLVGLHLFSDSLWK